MLLSALKTVSIVKNLFVKSKSIGANNKGRSLVVVICMIAAIFITVNKVKDGASNASDCRNEKIALEKQITNLIEQNKILVVQIGMQNENTATFIQSGIDATAKINTANMMSSELRQENDRKVVSILQQSIPSSCNESMDVLKKGIDALSW